jgi:hypothetical protein
MVSDNPAYRRETRSAGSELEWVFQIPHHELLSPEQKGGTHSESCYDDRSAMRIIHENGTHFGPHPYRN